MMVTLHLYIGKGECGYVNNSGTGTSACKNIYVCVRAVQKKLEELGYDVSIGNRYNELEYCISWE